MKCLMGLDLIKMTAGRYYHHLFLDRLIAYLIFKDGSGPCANGNCMDNSGRRGVVIKETTISCKWFCGWRAHCKTQICCASVKYMEF